jgi:hypothetical protein
MALGREQIYATFFSQLKQQLQVQPGALFNYCGRRSVSVGGLPVNSYPAFFLLEKGEEYERQVLFKPANVTLFATGLIQSLQGVQRDDSAIKAMNNLADYVEDAVQAASDSTATNTLNGLVQKVWIVGRQVTIPPSFGNKWIVQEVGIAIALPHSE